MNGQVQVERVGDLVVARICGEPSAELLQQCQDQVLALVRAGAPRRVLYDALAMQAPPVDVPWAQRELDEALDGVALRRAVVVPDSRLAFLARLAFGDSDYRVFYEDLDAAVKWLSGDTRA